MKIILKKSVVIMFEKRQDDAYNIRIYKKIMLEKFEKNIELFTHDRLPRDLCETCKRKLYKFDMKKSRNKNETQFVL